MRLLAIAIAALLAGCFGAPPAHPSAVTTTPSTTSQPACAGITDCPGGPVPTRSPAGQRPLLMPGLSFTYQTSGIYNSGREETVVVATRNESGYLFAGADREDLYEDAVWGREWTGPHSLDLDSTREGALRLFDWPLDDGKSWSIGNDITVTARRTQSGFHIAPTTGTRTLSYEYDPDVGYLTSYHSSKEKPYEALDIVKTGRAHSFVWYARGPAAEVGSDAHAPITLEVPAGFDALLVSAGGTTGSVLVQPPGAQAQPFTWQPSAAGESWAYASLPGTEGKWVLAALPGSDPNGFSFVRAVAVKWSGGQIPIDR